MISNSERDAGGANIPNMRSLIHSRTHGNRFDGAQALGAIWTVVFVQCAGHGAGAPLPHARGPCTNAAAGVAALLLCTWLCYYQSMYMYVYVHNKVKLKGTLTVYIYVYMYVLLKDIDTFTSKITQYLYLSFAAYKKANPNE